MNCFNVSIILSFIVCLVLQTAICDEKPKEYKVGEPQFQLQAAGGGNSPRNFNAGFNAGVGTKVWESKSKDKSLELGVSYGQNFARVDGHTYKSQPTYGLGGTFRWGKK